MIIADMLMAVKNIEIDFQVMIFNILQNIYLKNKKQTKIFTTIFHFFFTKVCEEGLKQNINKSTL